MSEAQRPLLPKGWQLIPGGILEQSGTTPTGSEAEPNLTSVPDAVVKELGKSAVKPPRTSGPGKPKEPLFEETVARPVTLSPLNSLEKGSAEPSISGISVTDSEIRDNGAIRAFNAISHFMKVQGGRSSEGALIERLLGAGFGEGKARKYIEQACAEEKLIKVGTFYRSTGT